ncbi:hypothetical protein TD95_003559 [Thielaviopsis punctulata]|uniref:Luciferase domain-containing protein n=1 Tax=Thielaviopsis punctulata TaxID=72032 RepID=A0A0F4ZHD3_9PEZI|nr:hypothetical protein TD95_003559 [Thielaviopsis punctulata]
MSTTSIQTNRATGRGHILLHNNAGPELSVYARGSIIAPKAISLTLSGPAILAGVCMLITVIHIYPFAAELTLALCPLIVIIHNDYQNFLNLGPGGTPSTFHGYLRITWLKLWTLRDPLVPPKVTPDTFPKTGILAQTPLPYRLGPRPRVAGIAPQRQVDQHGSETEYHSLRQAMTHLSLIQPVKFGTACSCFEKHGLALFARHAVNKTCYGEIFHIHDTDHSMHMCLHPEDLKEVLEKGWGQRHPLACKGLFRPNPVPETFVMIYGPRNDDELKAIYRVIEASIWYVTGQVVEFSESSLVEQ